MSGSLREYLLSLCAACLLVTVIMSVLRQGTAQRLAGIAGGLVIILTAISPLLKIDPDTMTRAVWKLNMDTEAACSGVEIGSRALLKQVITEKCESYILDKARNLGMQIQVEVTLCDAEDYPYPEKVILRGSWSVLERNRLSEYISEDLGVPAERQEWLSM